MYKSFATFIIIKNIVKMMYSIIKLLLANSYAARDDHQQTGSYYHEDLCAHGPVT